jgi:hypothetical protein
MDLLKGKELSSKLKVERQESGKIEGKRGQKFRVES